MKIIDEDEKVTSRKIYYLVPFFTYRYGLGDNSNVEEINVSVGRYLEDVSFTNYAVKGDVYCSAKGKYNSKKAIWTYHIHFWYSGIAKEFREYLRSV